MSLMHQIADISEKELLNIHFIERSSVFEFLLSIETALNRWHFPSWTDNIINTLGRDFFSKLQRLYYAYSWGCWLNELAVDFDEQDSIEKFFKYVEEMDEEQFVFYTLGRIVDARDIKNNINQSAIQKILTDKVGELYIQENLPDLSWLSNPLERRDKALELWKTYYYGFYKLQNIDFTTEYERKTEEIRDYISTFGIIEFIKYYTGSSNIPQALPLSNGYKRFTIIPIHHIPFRRRFYYGYGSTILLIPSLAEAKARKAEEVSRETLVNTFKALSDSSRLDLLKLISEAPYGLNGKHIAKKLDLSPSVVSRHLKQLKQAGILSERTPDKRNYYYKLVDDFGLNIQESIQKFFQTNEE